MWRRQLHLLADHRRLRSRILRSGRRRNSRLVPGSADAHPQTGLALRRAPHIRRTAGSRRIHAVSALTGSLPGYRRQCGSSNNLRSYRPGGPGRIVDGRCDDRSHQPGLNHRFYIRTGSRVGRGGAAGAPRTTGRLADSPGCFARPGRPSASFHRCSGGAGKTCVRHQLRGVPRKYADQRHLRDTPGRAVFRTNWFGRTVRALFDKTRTMPPSSPGSLPAETYADIVAHILEINGFASGNTALTADGEEVAAMRMQ